MFIFENPFNSTIPMVIIEIAVNIQTLTSDANQNPEETQTVKERFLLDGFLFLTTSAHCNKSDLKVAADEMDWRYPPSLGNAAQWNAVTLSSINLRDGTSFCSVYGPALGWEAMTSCTREIPTRYWEIILFTRLDKCWNRAQRGCRNLFSWRLSKLILTRHWAIWSKLALLLVQVWSKDLQKSFPTLVILLFLPSWSWIRTPLC